MIEIIYNKEKESAVGNEEYFCVPRNIRQVGQPSSDCKIYVEDYVYGYLAKNWKETENKGSLAILLGKSNWKDGIFYIFLKSAIVVEDIDITGEYLSIRDETWGKIYEEMKEYFPGQEVIGWYLSLPGIGMKITDMIKRIHLTHFGGNDKVLYLADPEEQDNAFFIYRNGRMERQAGYYIFYEKNEPMQEYILEKNPKASVDYTGKPQDRAVNDFRKIIARKREEKEAKHSNRAFGVLTTGVAVAAVVLGVLWLQKTPFGIKLFNKDSDEKILNETIVESVQSDTNEATEDVISDVTQESVGDTANSTEQKTVDSILNDAMKEMDENISSDTADGSKSANLDTADNILDMQGITGIIDETNQTSKNEQSELNQNNTASEAASNILQDDKTIDDTSSDSLSEQSAETASVLKYTEYTIRQGDTLSGISIRYYGDMSRVAEICKINDMLEEDTIYPGQKILLP